MIAIGGVIPPQDFAALEEAGAAAIFPPGTMVAEAAEKLLEELNIRRGYAQAAAGGGVRRRPRLDPHSPHRFRRLSRRPQAIRHRRLHAGLRRATWARCGAPGSTCAPPYCQSSTPRSKTQSGNCLNAHKPDVVLHLGLAGRRKTVSIETRAKNRLSIIHPDAAQRQSRRLHIETGGAPIRVARWPAERLAAAVSRSGCRAARSIDAGDYLCNQALYLSLGLHQGLCGFIHIPKPRNRRRIDWLAQDDGVEGSILPTLEDLERSVLAAMRLLAADHRRTMARRESA